MGSTAVDLYRLGNAASARMDNVRAGKDIATFDKDGAEWVKKQSGGVSTFSEPQQKKNEWKLGKGASYDDKLYVVNDHGNHWNWEPAEDMALAAFVGLLSGVNAKFVKVGS